MLEQDYLPGMLDHMLELVTSIKSSIMSHVLPSPHTHTHMHAHAHMHTRTVTDITRLSQNSLDATLIIQ